MSNIKQYVMKRFFLYALVSCFCSGMPDFVQAQSSFQVIITAPDTICERVPISRNQFSSRFIGLPGSAWNTYSEYWIVNGQVRVNFDHTDLQNLVPGSHTLQLVGIAKVGAPIFNQWDTARATHTVFVQPYNTCLRPQFAVLDTNLCAQVPIPFAERNGFTSIQISGFMPLWDMGDGARYLGIFNPNHIYQQAGTYHISYCLIDLQRQDTFCTSDSIVAGQRCFNLFQPTRVYSYFDSVCVGQPAFFQGGYFGPPGLRPIIRWDFGDGTSIAGGDTMMYIYN